MSSKVHCYLELTKPRIVFLVLVTAALGFFLAGRGIHSLQLFVWTMLGTGLSCAGSGVLNCYLERDVDALMERTRKRALPCGEVQPSNALALGILLVLAGTILLVAKVNLLTGFLAILTAFLYVLVYTPLKRTTWLNTFIGAIPGALPPVGGWVAVTNSLDPGAWVLFLILFIWQHPHFYAIAWMYREDYERGGFKMLPVVEPSGDSTFRQIIWYSLLLIPVSILPSIVGMSGPLYLIGALVLSMFLLGKGCELYRSRSAVDARGLLKATVLYLPILLILIIADVRY